MKLVVDANEMFAAVIARGKEKQSPTIKIFFLDDLVFYAPYRILVELQKHKEEIKAKSGFTEKDFGAFTAVLKARINFVPLENFSNKIGEAKKIAPHLKDVEYFALALKLNCPIWSEEKAFKKQEKVKIFTTQELTKLLEKSTSRKRK